MSRCPLAPRRTRTICIPVLACLVLAPLALDAQTRRAGPRTGPRSSPVRPAPSRPRPVPPRPTPPPPITAPVVQPAPGPRPALIGTFAPRGYGAPAPVATPIGGLQTRPLTSGTTSGTTRPVNPVPPYVGQRVGNYPYGERRPDRHDRDDYSRNDDRRGAGGGYGAVYGTGAYGSVAYGGVYPLTVVDAPLPRGVVVVYGADAASTATGMQGSAEGRLWAPTGDRPRWRIDSSLTPVQAWRDLIVNDMVCDMNGVCMEREQRTRAPWVAACRCYMLVDALGRRWRIEE